MEEKKLNYATQAGRNGLKGEDVSDLRKGPTKTRADSALPQKKLIASTCDIRFLSCSD
jgi:hypothetical protein